jgi:PhzF family phenazine biosynthesis protein
MHRFSQVDVFTDELLLGNPVAVVHDAQDLSDEQMHAFARWTNLSETTFLLPPEDPAADYRVRIFTTERELPFAGHPTLGSARAFLEAGGRSGTDLVQECGAGLVRIRGAGGRLAFAAPPLLRGGPVDRDLVRQLAGALGLRPDQVAGAQWADNGPGWVALLLTDAATVLAIEPDGAALRGSNVGVIGPYPAGAKSDPGADFEVRTFIPEGGLTEDPVTGSFNAAAAQWLIPAGLAPRSYTVSQGTRLQRRGRLFLEQADGDIWVGGHTVVGITGSVLL